MVDYKKIKKQLNKEASRNPQKFYPVKVLESLAYSRKKCKCGRHFWSQTSEKVCGDCEGYTFIGKKIGRTLSYVEVAQEFGKFMKKRGYAPTKRYPVVARWRKDIDFVHAAINNYQPYVVTGVVKPPANPLTVIQPSLRFNDIDNVGITGRHYVLHGHVEQFTVQPKSKFDQNKYFKDLHEWLTVGMKIPSDMIKYHEDAWGGGGNLGTSLEHFVGGLELGNQVYMTYDVNDDNSYTELKNKVLDMGAGQERYAWIGSGEPFSYDVVMPQVCKELYRTTGVKPNKSLLKKFMPHAGGLNVDEVDDVDKAWASIAKKIGVSKEKLRKDIEPLAALYSIADHTKALLYALNDGALPSNTGGGYNLRVILRRCWDLIEKYNWNIDLKKTMSTHARSLKAISPELSNNLKDIKVVIDVEKVKYKNAKQSIKNFIKSLAGQSISEKKLLELYDSKGISPQFLKQEGAKYKIKVDIPKDFYMKVSERHEDYKGKIEKEEKEVPNVAITQPLYYADEKAVEFKAKVLRILDNRYVLLNETLFYSTAGGQAHDIGDLNGSRVVDVQKWGKHIVHEVEDINFKTGDTVIGKIDWNRRWDLMRHHTGTHVTGGAARKVLGNHIWQAGSDVKPNKARLDITHYETLTKDDIKKIEKVANDAIKKKIPVNKQLMLKDEAEKKYGFVLYQGGFIPGGEVRVVNVRGFDVQACGGTHLNNTSEIGMIKILGAKRIQDGIIRLEYVCGDAAKAYVNERKQIYRESLNAFNAKGSVRDDALEKAAEIFSVRIQDLPKTITRFMKDVHKQHGLLGLSQKASDKILSGLAKTATSDLAKANSKLFDLWKKQRKEVKKTKRR